MTHSSPSRSARVFRPARSEPASGSLKSWHHLCSPVRIGKRNRCFCSSVAQSNNVGATRYILTPEATPTAPALKSSSLIIRSVLPCKFFQYQALGHDGHAHPAIASFVLQVMRSPLGSQFSETQALNPSRICSMSMFEGFS